MCLDPKWAGGRPRRITIDDQAFNVEMARARPAKLGLPFTHWSIRKLVGYLADNSKRRVVIGRERLRQTLERHDVTFQRTKTWKKSNDRAREAKLDRIEAVLADHPERFSRLTNSGRWRFILSVGAAWRLWPPPAKTQATASTPRASSPTVTHLLLGPEVAG